MTVEADATTIAVAVAVVVPGQAPDPTPDLVPPSERDRIARLHRPDDRWSALAGWAVASRIVATRLGVEPADLVVDRSCGRCGSGEHGKPQFRGSGLHLSLSHTRGCALVAVSPGVPIGVDVEPTAADRWPPGEDARTWTVREAVLKCRGVGLGAPWEPSLVDGVQVRELAVPAAYVATLAAQTGGPVAVVYEPVLSVGAP